MSTFGEILSPSFLLRDALVGSVLVGLACPLVGVYFVLRRMVFLGVALPQVSAAGIAAAFLGYRLAVGPHEHGQVAERTIALFGSLGFTLLALLFLAALEQRRSRQSVEVRIGVTYAMAAAATILFLAADPYAEAQLVGILKGDILATTRSSLSLVATVLGGVVAALLVFRRELLLVSFDRDMAAVLGFRTRVWDTLLYLLIGITISFGVMTAGPMVTFGFLIIPPVTARMVARRMLTFSLVAALLGGATAFLGFAGAYRWDLPLGPAEVAVASILLLVVAAGRALVRLVAGGTVRMGGAAAVILLAIAAGCVQAPPSAPPPPVAAVAVLPPVNRTGDPLLVAGTSLLERYALDTPRVTVPDLIAAEARRLLRERGVTVGDTRTGGAALRIDVWRWQPDSETQPASVIVALDATLFDVESGQTLWSVHRAPYPIPTQGAVTLGVAYEMAARAAVADVLAAWPSRANQGP